MEKAHLLHTKIMQDPNRPKTSVEFCTVLHDEGPRCAAVTVQGEIEAEVSVARQWAQRMFCRKPNGRLRPLELQASNPMGDPVVLRESRPGFVLVVQKGGENWAQEMQRVEVPIELLVEWVKRQGRLSPGKS